MSRIRSRHLIDGVFAGPAQAQAGERDADLGDAEQPSGIRQQAPARRARRRCPAPASSREPGPPHGHQRHLRGGKEAVQQRRWRPEESGGATFRVSLQSSSVAPQSPLLAGDQSEHSGFAGCASGRGVLVRLAAAAANLGRDRRAGFRESHRRRATRWACRTSQAASWEDAIFLQGYVTAQDRMWQMDALRRLAAGELAEVVGKAALESDQECAAAAAVADRRTQAKNHAGRRSGRARRLCSRRELLSGNASRTSCRWSSRC